MESTETQRASTLYGRKGSSDSVTQGLYRIFDGLAEHSRGFILVLAIVLAIMIVLGFSLSHREAKSADARNALFEAQKALETEMTAMAPPAPKPPAPKAGEKAPPPTSPAEDFENKPFDVDVKLPKAVQLFQSVVTTYPNTRTAFDAEMALGHLYLRHGQAAKSEPWFNKATEHAPSGLDRPLSWIGLGYARENEGKYADAIQAFEKALNYGEPSVKGDTLLAIARNYEALKDNAKAKETYDRVIRDLPNTEAAKNAELFKSALP